MDKISILCPTRKRPDNVSNLYKSIVETVKNPENVQLILGLDVDDAEGIERARNLEGSVAVKMDVGERRHDLSAYYNNLLWVAGKEQIYILAADDITFMTKEWDIELQNGFVAVPDRILLGWMKDRDPAPNRMDCATHPILHWNWAVAVGYLVPPGLSRCLDVWMLRVATTINRFQYFENLRIHHPTWPERHNKDQTLRDLDNRIGHDNHQFSSRTHDQNTEISKLRQFIKVINDVRLNDLKKIESCGFSEDIMDKIRKITNLSNDGQQLKLKISSFL